MMQYASQGLRNASRKGSNTLVHGRHNGPSGGTATSTQARSIHLFFPIRGGQAALHAPPPLPSGPTAPRNVTNRLFSISRNLFQKFFTLLTAPGLKAPIYLPEHIGSRSLHSSVLRANTIQNRLSTAVRYSLRNNALQRQANTFLPRGPGPVPPRFGGVAQIGLGMARNFSTGRPIFQHLADNVPVAVRALYEADLDLELKKHNECKRLMATNVVNKVKKTKEMIKPLQKSPKRKALATMEHIKPAELQEEVEHYFSVPVAPVSTYLLIPLAPTPTSRVPLPLDPLPSRPGPSQDPKLLPPLSYVSSLHTSHATHSLRVSSLFTRLDQANVWARGVRCSAYSQGDAHRKRPKAGENASDEGVCTILKVEFIGWSKAEVRSVIGESGTGWCVLEEVLHEEDEGFTDMESLSSEFSEEDRSSDESLGMGVFGGSGVAMIDPSEPLILPTLDFSSSFISSSRSSSSPSHNSSSNDLFAAIPSEMENDPWVDDYYDWSSSGSSRSESSAFIDPPSSNGWFGSGQPGLGFSSQIERMRDEVEPREIMFN